MTTETTSRPTKRRLVVGFVVASAVLAAVALVWFQPQKLFVDEQVNEAVPMVSDAMHEAEDTTSDSITTRTVMGTFTALAHPTKGGVVVSELSDGSRVLRLEDFETSNGPDVRVYLSAGPKSSYGKDVVDLGALKGNVGNQNYVVPAGTDLERYDTAVIWCRRFTVAFGAAELS